MRSSEASRFIKWGSPKGKTYKPKGHVSDLPHDARLFVNYWTQVCKPGGVYICDGSDSELEDVMKPWVHSRIVNRTGLKKLGLLFRTDPRDTGKAFNSRTFFVSGQKDETTLPTNKEGVAKYFTNDQWRSFEGKFMSSMAGRRMYVIPFKVGPIDSYQMGVLITDSPYVYVALRMEVRVSSSVWRALEEGRNRGVFIKWIHSVGCPRPSVELVRNHWPCDPTEAVLAFNPQDLKIKSYGSGVLNPTRCLFQLLLNYTLDQADGWIVTPFSILSIKTPLGDEFFVAMAMAKGCDETIDMAEYQWSLSGYCVKIIALNRMTYFWMDEEDILRACNPLIGFSGAGDADVNSNKNPELIKVLRNCNALYLNAALKNKSAVHWEGIDAEMGKDDEIIDWRGFPWSPKEHSDKDGDGGGGSGRGGSDGGPAAHPDCRYHCHYFKYACMHTEWNDPNGVPISAFIFGGKRSKDVPVVYECKSWVDGILTGVCLKTKTVDPTKNLEDSLSGIRDPMAMNGLLQDDHILQKYLKRWLKLEAFHKKMPRVFHVNWWPGQTLQDGDKVGHETWPGKTENIRILDWMLRRVDGHDDIVLSSPIGYLPRPGTINMKGLEDVKLERLLTIGKKFWLDELADNKTFLEQRMEPKVPNILLKALKKTEAELMAANEDDLSLTPRYCSQKVPDKCYACLGPPFKTKKCTCSK